MARCEPSGDKLQLPSGSTCGGTELFPFFKSNRNVSEVFPFEMLYRQTVDGERAHCTFQMWTSLSTRRGAPPAIGRAKMEEGVSGPADWGVEIYKISEPSGVTLGCESFSALVITLSATRRSLACLKISGVPFRSELNRTALLSGVQENGMLTLSSSVSRLFSSKCVPSAARVP